MKSIFKLMISYIVILLLSCGSGENSAAEGSRLLESNYTISLSQSELIVNDTVKLTVETENKEDKYNLKIQFIGTNLEFIQIIKNNHSLTTKENNELNKNNLKGPVTFEFSTDIASKFRVKVSITTDTQSFDKEFDLNVSNSDGTGPNLRATNIYHTEVHIFNDTSIDLSRKTIAPAFSPDEKNSFYGLFYTTGMEGDIFKAGKNYIMQSPISTRFYHSLYKIQTKLFGYYSCSNCLILESKENHSYPHLIRLRIKEHVIKFVNNSDQKIKSIKVSNSKDDVLNMKNSLTDSLDKGEFIKKNAYYINNGCQPIYYHIERENSRYEDIQTLDLNCDEPVQTVSFENNDDLLIKENELKVLNVSSLPLKSVTINDTLITFKQPLTKHQFQYIQLPEACNESMQFSYQLDKENFISYTKNIECKKEITIAQPATFVLQNMNDFNINTINVWESPFNINSDVLKEFQGAEEASFLNPRKSQEVYISCLVDSVLFELIIEGRKGASLTKSYDVGCGDIKELNF